MGFSLGQFISGAAAAGVSNADEAIKHRDALDLQQHQDDAAAMRQTALANLQHDNSIDLAQKASDISANAVSDARDKQVSDVNDEAQRLANVRSSAANGIINDQMQAAKDSYINSNLSDADKKLGIDAADKYAADNAINATPTDLERVHASVNAGYAKVEDLMKLDQQDRANAIAALQLRIRERHEDGIEALNQSKDDHWQGMIAAMNYRTDSKDAAASNAAKVPESIKEAIWLKDNKDNPDLIAAYETARTAKNKTGISNTPDSMGGMYMTNNETGQVAHFVPGLNGKPSRTEIVTPATKGSPAAIAPVAPKAVLNYDPVTREFK